MRPPLTPPLGPLSSTVAARYLLQWDVMQHNCEGKKKNTTRKEKKRGKYVLMLWVNTCSSSVQQETESSRPFRIATLINKMLAGLFSFFIIILCLIQSGHTRCWLHCVSEWKRLYLGCYTADRRVIYSDAADIWFQTQSPWDKFLLHIAFCLVFFGFLLLFSWTSLFKDCMILMLVLFQEFINYPDKDSLLLLALLCI